MLKKVATRLTCAMLCGLCLCSGSEAGTLSRVEIVSSVRPTVRVGRSFRLSALAFDDENVEITSSVSFSWSSSNPAVLAPDRSGLITAVGAGTATITATAERVMADGGTETLSKSTELIDVLGKMTNMTIDSNALNDLDEFNTQKLFAQAMELDFVDADPSEVNDAAFQRSFHDIWNTYPTQVTNVSASSLALSTRGEKYESTAGTARRAGISVSLTGVRLGDLLPLKYVWSYTWDELSKLFGRNVTSQDVPTAKDVFNSLTVELHTSTGDGANSFVVVGYGGIDADDAEAGNALWLHETDTGISIELDVYVASVRGSSASLVESSGRTMLVVPDGSSDQSILATLWMMERPSSGRNNGGGGCDSGLVTPGVFALALAALAGIKNKTRGEHSV